MQLVLVLVFFVFVFLVDKQNLLGLYFNDKLCMLHQVFFVLAWFPGFISHLPLKKFLSQRENTGGGLLPT